MVSINNVARHILSKKRSLSTMKLQKLVFYSQAHALSTTGLPLFDSDFQAWRAGPVAVDLYRLHRGNFFVSQEDIPPCGDELSDEQIAIIDYVYATLGDLSGRDLSYRTHEEQPWKDARGELGPAESCNVLITKENIANYYRQHPITT
ncbi:Panacea domain-containing protein [Arcanobacterium pinnipediorum]|uniref:DUF4065 domain-containing protein n=1 Tax=Arcanobacterium pinnipediorum TaxID=1503041 RepID=A0ABY5AH44_9ACTO|nr:type II toxin-antitoxin system antitoxin SocA domain-containing protein [Arcanobacterium pinnipediorum]USR79170.1 DUF4065 domain-containing protein [Arcanobacterium pinnipediorum]